MHVKKKDLEVFPYVEVLQALVREVFLISFHARIPAFLVCLFSQVFFVSLFCLLFIIVSHYRMTNGILDQLAMGDRSVYIHG